MTLEHLITEFGYPVVVAGTFLEGETVLIVAGFLARRGYLDLTTVILSAFIGAFAGDQFFFRVGRWRGMAWLESRPRLGPRVARVRRVLQNYRIPVLLGGRFFWGFRTALPIVLGATGAVRPLVFFCFNAVSACCWATLVGGAGFLFGQAVELFLRDVKHVELQVALLLLVVGLLAWLRQIVRTRRRAS